MNDPLSFVTPNFGRTKPDTILRALPNQVKFITIRVHNKNKKIHINNIVRIEASSNYALIYLQNSCRPIVSAKTLKHYINILGLKEFIYPHKSHLINKIYINNYSFHNRPYIRLHDNSIIPISRRKIKGIKQVLKLKNHYHKKTTLKLVANIFQ